MPNYHYFGMGSLPPEGLSVTHENELTPMDGNCCTPDVEKLLAESEEMIRLPSHLERLFSTTPTYSKQDFNLFHFDTLQFNQPTFPISDAVASYSAEELVPVELGVCSDSMDSNQLLGYDLMRPCGLEGGIPCPQESLEDFAMKLGGDVDAGFENGGEGGDFWPLIANSFGSVQGFLISTSGSLIFFLETWRELTCCTASSSKILEGLFLCSTLFIHYPHIFPYFSVNHTVQLKCL